MNYIVSFYVKRNGRTLHYTFHTADHDNAKSACEFARIHWEFNSNNDHMYKIHAAPCDRYDNSFYTVTDFFGTKYNSLSVLDNFILVDIESK